MQHGLAYFLRYNPNSVQAAVGGSEPSDAVRAVNALLTQLDKLKRFPNVLILTTSNITGTTHMSVYVCMGSQAWYS